MNGLLQAEGQAQWERDSGCTFTEQMRVSLAELHSKGRLDVDVLLPLLWPDVTSQPERDALLEYMHKFELCHPLADDAGMWMVPSVSEEAQTTSFWSSFRTISADSRGLDEHQGDES